MAAKTPGDDTTRRSAEPSEKGKSAAGAAIRWLHPFLGLSPLSEGQTLGRDESCEIVLRDDEVSRRHARVQLRGLVPVITDLDSRNGVYVNGQREKQVPIGPSDVVRIGSSVGVVVEHRSPDHDRFDLVELFPG